MPRYSNFFLSSLFCLSTSAQAAGHFHCDYNVDPNSVKVTWTAFKTTAKTPVGGAFKQITFTEGKGKPSALNTSLVGASVTVDLASVDTGNPARDQTLSNAFFKSFIGDLKGTVKEVHFKITKNTNRTFSGKLLVDLMINGTTQTVPLDAVWSAKTSEWSATGTIDILNFGLSAALQSLGTACQDPHKGPDGVSKTWSEVGIKISASLKEDCTKKSRAADITPQRGGR